MEVGLGVSWVGGRNGEFRARKAFDRAEVDARFFGLSCFASAYWRLADS